MRERRIGHGARLARRGRRSRARGEKRPERTPRRRGRTRDPGTTRAGPLDPDGSRAEGCLSTANRKRYAGCATRDRARAVSVELTMGRESKIQPPTLDHLRVSDLIKL